MGCNVNQIARIVVKNGHTRIERAAADGDVIHSGDGVRRAEALEVGLAAVARGDKEAVQNRVGAVSTLGERNAGGGGQLSHLAAGESLDVSLVHGKGLSRRGGGQRDLNGARLARQDEAAVAGDVHGGRVRGGGALDGAACGGVRDGVAGGARPGPCSAGPREQRVGDVLALGAHAGGGLALGVVGAAVRAGSSDAARVGLESVADIARARVRALRVGAGAQARRGRSRALVHIRADAVNGLVARGTGACVRARRVLADLVHAARVRVGGALVNVDAQGPVGKKRNVGAVSILADCLRGVLGGSGEEQGSRRTAY